MCDCASNNSCGCSSSITLPYLQGDAGLNGVYGGHSAKWFFNSTTSPNPGNGTLRFNNSNQAAATVIYIDNLDYNNVDMDSFLDTFDNSSNYGFIRIFKEFDQNTFWIGTITNVGEPSGAYHQLNVTINKSNGTFANGDAIVVTFTPKGEPGNNGADGSNKAYVLETHLGNPQVSTYTTSGDFAETLTVPSGLLVNEGDAVLIDSVIKVTDSTDDILYGEINGNRVFQIKVGIGEVFIKGEINRDTNTSVYSIFSLNNTNFISSDPDMSPSTTTYHSEVFTTVSSLSANDLIFTLGLESPVAGTHKLVKLQSKIILL
jgi:hypothetical protein